MANDIPGTRSSPSRSARAGALLAAALISLGVGGCASRSADRSGLFEPYRVSLPQGNYITREMLDQVKPGMTREQVRFALGSPLLNPMFRDDRWTYVFRFQHANGTSELRRVAVFFKDNRVADIQADELPLRDDASDPALPGYKPPADRAGGTQ